MVRELRKDFSMVGELIVFSVLWLGFTNLGLFLTVQGLQSGWFTSQAQYYSVFYWLYLARSVSVSAVCTIPALMQT